MNLILNRNFELPADGWHQLAPLGEFPHAAAGIIQVIDAAACTAMVASFDFQKKSSTIFPGLLSGLKTEASEKWGDVIDRTIEKVRAGETVDDQVPTGFIDLDKLLKGLHKTDMIVLAARPSMGKTSLAMNIAEHAALGRPGGKKHAIGVFSLEMSQDQLARRMLFSKARITAGKEFFSGEDHARLTNEMQRYEYEISPRGHISYSAPSGFHDDCVMALALANHRRWETESCGPMLPLAPKGRFSPFAARPRIMTG